MAALRSWRAGPLTSRQVYTYHLSSWSSSSAPPSSVLQRRTWPLSLLHVSRGPSWSIYHPRYPFSLLEGICRITSITPLINQSTFIVFVMFIVVYLTSRYYNDKKWTKASVECHHMETLTAIFLPVDLWTGKTLTTIFCRLICELEWIPYSDTFFLGGKILYWRGCSPNWVWFKKLCITTFTHDFLYLGLAFFITKTPNVLFFIIGNSLFFCTIKLLHSTDVIGLYR